MCPVQDIEVVIDWFSAVVWGTIRMCNSPICGTSEFTYPVESVDQEVYCTGTFFYK